MIDHTDLKAKVFEKIRSGQVPMRSRLYFVLRVFALAALAALVFALAALVLSYVFFSIHESGEQFLLGFGERGLLVFFTLFPWKILLAVLALIILLEWSLRSFRFGYRVPILYIFFATLGVVAAAGMLISYTPFHSMLLEQADRDELPFVGSYYERVHEQHEDRGVFRGVVVSISGSSFMIAHDDHDRDPDDGMHTVVASPDFDIAALHVGDSVYVAGDMNGSSTVRAYGIQVSRHGAQ